MLRKNVKSIVFSAPFAFCVILTFFSMFIGDIGIWNEPAREDGKMGYSLMDQFFTAWTLFGYLMTALPLLASIPAGFHFYDEKKYGIMQQKLLRQGSFRYNIFTVGTAALSGFFLVFISQCLYTGFIILISEGSIHFTDSVGIYSGTEGIFGNMLATGKGFQVFLIVNLACCVYGMIWPVFGIAASVWGRGRCIALIVPFVLWCLLDHITAIITWFIPQPYQKWYLYYLDISNITLFGSLSKKGWIGIFYAFAYGFICILIGFIIFSLGVRHIRKKGVSI